MLYILGLTCGLLDKCIDLIIATTLSSSSLNSGTSTDTDDTETASNPTTATMPDQVKYTNLLKDKKVLVIGGSSGELHHTSES